MDTSILEHTRIRKMMGLIKEETTKSTFTAGDLRNNWDFKQGFLKMIKEVFEPQGNWGTADVPDIDCYTNEGVINVYTFSDYSEKENVPSSNWSIINFFNTNAAVEARSSENLFQHTALILRRLVFSTHCPHI